MADERNTEEFGDAAGAGTRRTLLKLGALAVPAVVTLKPAMAQAQASLAMCRIPIETAVDANGKPISPSSMTGKHAEGAFLPPSKGYYYGQELIDYQQSGILPNDVGTEQAFEAHIKYIKSLRPGDNGFTCLTSLVHKL